MFITFDRESAKASGIKVGRLDLILSLMTALTVVLGMKVVGILLVSALVVLPAAAGLQLSSNFRQAVFISTLVSLASVVLGLILSIYLDIPASGSIVILAFLFFIIFLLVKKKKAI